MFSTLRETPTFYHLLPTKMQHMALLALCRCSRRPRYKMHFYREQGTRRRRRHNELTLWFQHEPCRQTKIIFSIPNPSRSRDIINNSKKDTGLLTGFSFLQYQRSQINGDIDPMCSAERHGKRGLTALVWRVSDGTICPPSTLMRPRNRFS